MSDDRKIAGDVIAYTAGVFIITSFIIQIVKMIRLKSFRELSYKFITLQAIVYIMYGVYGILEDLIPIYSANSIILIELIIIIVLKYIFDKKYPIDNKIQEITLEKLDV
jgi:MtN3 and saliva related transmembrane protein